MSRRDAHGEDGSRLSVMSPEYRRRTEAARYRGLRGSKKRALKGESSERPTFQWFVLKEQSSGTSLVTQTGRTNGLAKQKIAILTRAPKT